MSRISKPRVAAMGLSGRATKHNSARVGGLAGDWQSKRTSGPTRAGTTRVNGRR